MYRTPPSSSKQASGMNFEYNVNSLVVGTLLAQQLLYIYIQTSAPCLASARDRPTSVCEEVDLAELFAGSATLSKEFYYQGKEVVACDSKYGRGTDICKSSGFGILAFDSAIFCCTSVLILAANMPSAALHF